MPFLMSNQGRASTRQESGCRSMEALISTQEPMLLLNNSGGKTVSLGSWILVTEPTTNLTYTDRKSA